MRHRKTNTTDASVEKGNVGLRHGYELHGQTKEPDISFGDNRKS